VGSSNGVKNTRSTCCRYSCLRS